MDISRKSCRLCLSETDFSVSLFGSYCRRTNMIEKILVCLKLVIEDSDYLDTICYKCAENIERYYEFVVNVRKCQARYNKQDSRDSRPKNIECSPMNRRHVKSYVREEVFDADYTFSFLEIPNEEKLEPKVSSPFFSYFSPPSKMVVKQSENSPKKETNPIFSYFSPPSLVVNQSNKEPYWKTPNSPCENSPKKENRYKRPHKTERSPHHLSRDLFESQSQDNDPPKSVDWTLTPDDNIIIKRVRQKCFGRSNY